MILKDLFQYFSEFVPVAVLADTFQSSTGAPYDSLKTLVMRQADTARTLPGIRSFIIGVDAEAVRQKISQADGTFLFIEYSNVASRIDARTDRKEDRLHVAVTVATPIPSDWDQPAVLLSNDSCLEMMKTIRDALRDDRTADGRVQWCEFPATLSPFYSRALANSSGWSMEFDVLGYDIV